MGKSKKIISLGGNFFQMTAVKAAKQMGHYVIDVDYLPNNPAHKFADEYYNISTLDKEKVLELAKKEKIDGIISYASDVSAPTAAWVAEQMGLPTNPYETVCIMAQKDKFHPFLKEKGFYIPNSISVGCIDDVYDFFEKNNRNIMLKPISSSGSKGVSHIVDKDMIVCAYEEALKYSFDKKLVAEEFIQRDGYQIDGDVFIVDGRIVFFGLGNEHFNENCNPLVPVGESFPVDLSEEKIEVARKEIQRAIDALGVKNGAINLEFMFDKNGKVFIIELGPRNGGNLITDAIKCSTGIDLAEYTVKAALGEDISELKDVKWNKYISSYIWHSEQDGIYDGIEISKELESKIIKTNMFVNKGDEIHRFNNGGYGLGAAILEFDNKNQMLNMMDNMNEFYSIRR